MWPGHLSGVIGDEASVWEKNLCCWAYHSTFKHFWPRARQPQRRPRPLPLHLRHCRAVHSKADLQVLSPQSLLSQNSLQLVLPLDNPEDSRLDLGLS